MDLFGCDICLESFSEETRKPKMVDCGHTICSVCLETLLQSLKTCPTCKAPFIKSAVAQFQTNYIVLQQTRLTKEMSKFYRHHIASEIKKFVKKCVVAKDLLLGTIHERTVLLAYVTNNLACLNMLLERNPDESWVSEAEIIMEEVKDDFEKVDRILFGDSTANLKLKYSLKNYINENFYLFEIANRVHNGENIYAYAMVKSKLKYGKVTMHEDGIINIHALDLSSVDEKASLVSFQDLKACASEVNFRTFIQFKDQMLSFQIIYSTVLAMRFIKLCTGEDGPMMKGSLAVTHQKEPRSRYGYTDHMEYVRIDKYKQTEGKNESMMDYDMQIYPKKVTSYFNEPEKIKVRMFKDGPCELIKCLSNIENIPNIVAETVDDDEINLHTSEHVEITDSGFSLAM